jgi:hypothetical protein
MLRRRVMPTRGYFSKITVKAYKKPVFMRLYLKISLTGNAARGVKEAFYPTSSFVI